MYQHIDALMLRAPAADRPPIAPPLCGAGDGHPAKQAAWLRQVWSDTQTREAIEHASPDLAARIASACAGRRLPARDLRRIVISLLRYLLRRSARATPFGLLAGVAPARVGHTGVSWPGKHRACARVDAEWLAGLIDDLERDATLRPHLTVTANHTCHIRGHRLIVPYAVLRGGEVGELSMRHSPPVAQALAAARSPIRVADLIDKLAGERGAAHTVAVTNLVTGLISNQALVSSLRPPTTVVDPLDHLHAQLTACGADRTPSTATTVAALAAIRADLRRHNAASTAESGGHRVAVSETMRRLRPSDRLLAVDLLVDAHVTVADTVCREAQTAAAVLARVNPYPAGYPNWRRYHAAFLDRYGPGALVPLLDLVNPDIGLGYPAGYRDSIHPSRPPALTDRDHRLLAWAQTAALRGHTEITLSDTMIASLAGEPADTIAPTVELATRVHATSAKAVDRGDFQLVVTGVSRAAGVMTGRFWPLLDPADQRRFTDACASLPTCHADALAAQVSAAPLTAAAGNVTRTPATLPVINVAEHPESRRPQVALTDLAVAADATRLRMTHVGSGQTVEPTMFHALELANHAHPLARFLCELPHALSGGCVAFSWGAAEHLPFLPRLRHGRAVLSPARWRLRADDLDPRSGWRRWTAGLAQWRDRAHTPTTVFLGDDDQRLRLDLTEPAHAYLLRAHLDRAGVATLREAPADQDLGWIGGRVHEIVIPLAATARPRTSPPSRSAIIRRAHGHLPAGSTWLYARVRAHPSRHATILTDHLPRLLDAWRPCPPWWFIRYHESRPHLRLRWRLGAPADFGEAAGRVAAWVAALRAAGLADDLDFATYRPETGRFGVGVALDAAHLMFAADSQAALAQLAARIDVRVSTAASLIDLVSAFAGNRRAGLRWLAAHAPRHGRLPVDRAALAETLRLVTDATSRSAVGWVAVEDVWRDRRTRVADYRRRLDDDGCPDPDQVLASLLHLHHARMIGVDADSERTCLRLARAAAVSLLSRPAAIR